MKLRLIERMTLLDALIIARVFSPLSWWIERLTKKNNYWQAVYAFQACAFFATVSAVLNWWREALPIWVVLFGILVWCGLAFPCAASARRLAVRLDRKPDALPVYDGLVHYHSGAWRWALVFLCYLPLDVNDACYLALHMPGIEKITALFAFTATSFGVGLYLCAVPRPPARRVRKPKRPWSFGILQPIATRSNG